MTTPSPVPIPRLFGETTLRKDQPNGYAGLDAAGLVDQAVLPSFPAVQIDPTMAPYNAVFDAQHVVDAVVGPGGVLNKVQSATAGPLWQATSPVGKVFWASDQGVGGTSDLWGVITAFDGASTITLSVPVPATASAQVLAWGTDDTTAMNAVFAAALVDGVTIRLPANRAAMYNGPGLASANPCIVAPALNRPQFYLGPTSSVIVGQGPSAGITSLHVVNLFTFGGKHPLVRLTYPGTNSSFSRYNVLNCRSEYFRGTMVSSLASDHPYWKIDVMARNPLVERGVAVALAGYTDACDIRVDCIAVNGVKVGRGGNSAVVHHSSWIYHTYAGTPRWCVWHTPETTSTNSGRGFLGHNLRFGNEGYNNADFRVLLADEDIDSGADFASRTPLWTPSMVNTPTFTTVSGTNSSGSSTLNVVAGPSGTSAGSSNTAGALVLTVNTGSGWAAGMALLVGSGGTLETVTVASTYVPGSTSIPLTSGLAFTHAAGDTVVQRGFVAGMSVMVGTGVSREVVTVDASYVSGTALPLTTPLAHTHTAGDRVLAGLSGWISGLTYRDCLVVGSGASTTGPVIYSTASNVGGCAFEQIQLNSTPPAIAFQYLTVPTGAFSSTNRLLHWKTSGSIGRFTQRVIPSNDPAVQIIDPDGVFQTFATQFTGGGDRGGYAKLLTTRVRSFTVQGTGGTTPILDDRTQSNAAEFNPLLAFDGAYATLTGVQAGEPIWIEFTLQAGSPALPQVIVTLEGNNALPTINQWLLTVPSTWQTFRLLHPGIGSGLVPSPIYLRFKITGTMSPGKVQIARARVYHGIEPIPPLHTYPVQAIVPQSNWYFQPNYVVQTPSIPAVGNLRVQPVFLAEDAPGGVTQMFAEFTAAGSADSLIVPCLFNDNGSFLPGDLVCQAQSISTGTGNAGTVATGGTPGIYFATVSTPVPLKAGLYWVGSVQQGTTGATMRMGAWGIGGFGTSSAPGTNAITVAYQQTGVTGALPTSFTASPGSVTQAARIGVKFG